MVAFLPTKKVAFLVVLGPVDLATGKTPIENVDHRRASPADGRPIRQPDNNSGQRHTEIILETTANGYNDLHSLWRKAEADESEFMPVFLPWFVDPEYRREIDVDFVMDAEESKLADLYKLDKEQIAGAYSNRRGRKTGGRSSQPQS